MTDLTEDDFETAMEVLEAAEEHYDNIDEEMASAFMEDARKYLSATESSLLDKRE